MLNDDERFFNVNAKMLRNTLICNFLNGCAASLPCGVGALTCQSGFSFQRSMVQMRGSLR
jgi:aspartyl-tRNA(Asn)/glutamyl-tRNA(Gln) amidotransferase subunit A